MKWSAIGGTDPLRMTRIEEAKAPILTVKQGLKSGTFWLCFAMLFTGIFYGLMVVAIYKPMDLDALSDSTLTVTGMFAFTCNGSSRIVWATI